MFLHELKSPKGSRRKRKLLGRGPASGSGKQSGRGDKGQRSRSGRGIIMGSEGGQSRLIRRIPKFGFTPLDRTVYQIVQMDQLNVFNANTVVDADALKKAQLISSRRKVYKILFRGEIKKPLTVKAYGFSTTAAEAIVKAGGKTELLIRPKKAADAARNEARLQAKKDKKAKKQ
ncbi:MAG: 50S ribosomal protein L15 [Candidatus Omnitrophica bacterium]|nr:50S ribosomal protein L15 [Candidatus Omnitrophota bacterium]